MRKWILRWLTGCDDEDWHDMFKIAVSSHESCKKMLETNKHLLEKYRAVCEEQNAVLRAVSDSENIPELMLKIIAIIMKERADHAAD